MVGDMIKRTTVEINQYNNQYEAFISKKTIFGVVACLMPNRIFEKRSICKQATVGETVQN